MLLTEKLPRVALADLEVGRESGGRVQAIEALRGALERDNAATRCAAARSLAQMNAGGPETTQALIGLLRDTDPDVRVDATAALGRLQAADAVGVLVASLEDDPEGEVRIEAAKALGRIGSLSAVEPLIRCLRREGYPELDALAGDSHYAHSWEVQNRALEALGEIGDARAADAVIEALAAEDAEALQESAFGVLARLGGARARTYLLGELRTGTRLARRRAARALAALPQLRGEGSGFPPEFVQPLMDALLDADASVRIEAARALAASGDPAAAIAITLLLTDRDAEVRKAAATLCAGMRAESTLERLHGLLFEPEPELKKLVVRILGEIGNPASVAPLAAWLGDDDDDLVAEVVRALGEIGRPGEEKRVAAILADPKRHHSARTLAARALGRLLGQADRAEGRRFAEETLAAAVHDRDERVSHAALCALVESDPAGAPGRLVQLIEAPAQPVEGRGGESTAEIPPELRDLVQGHSAQTSTLAAIFAARGVARSAAMEYDAAPALSQALRILAVRLLGNCTQPGAAALGALCRMGAAQDAAMRREALLSLGRIGDARGLDTLLAGLDDEAREVRLGALDGVAALHDVPRLAARLVALCDDPDAEVRVRAVSALAATSEPEAMKRLARALQDESREVCRAALRALSPASCTAECRERVVNLAYRFCGDLRIEAAAVLRRLGSSAAAEALLATLHDPGQEERHGVAAEALGELFAAEAA